MDNISDLWRLAFHPDCEMSVESSIGSLKNDGFHTKPVMGQRQATDSIFKCDLLITEETL